MKTILLLACIVFSYTYGETFDRARIGEETGLYDDLTTLPLPKNKIYVAVYKFKDQTGQYRTTSTGQSFSTAVTQGSTSLLMKALEDSNWFIPIEREGLSSLLNERTLIQKKWKLHGTKNKQMPPLLHADIILEGGIIAYETNMVTGGHGLRYLGIGGHTKMQKDQVTVYLRAVSTKTGQVLKTVHASKTIFSKVVSAGVYKFVKFKSLLEIETGYGTNEPSHLCVKEAIEKAVISLIIEGEKGKLWIPKDETEWENHTTIATYFKEKKTHYKKLSLKHDDNKKKVTILISSGAQLGHNTNNKTIEGAGTITVVYPVAHTLRVGGLVNMGKVGDRYLYESKIGTLGLIGQYDLFPDSKVSCSFDLGFTVSKSWSRSRSQNLLIPKKKFFKTLLPGFTMGTTGQWDISKQISISTTISRFLLFNHTHYGTRLENGQERQGYWFIGSGVALHL